MLTEIEKYYLINQHLKGNLSEEENAVFQKALLENPSLQREIELHALANMAIEQNFLIDVKAATRKVLEKNKPSSHGWKWGLSLGLLGLGFGWIGITFMTSAPPQQETSVPSPIHDVPKTPESFIATTPSSPKIKSPLTRPATANKNQTTNFLKREPKVDTIPSAVLPIQTEELPKPAPIPLPEKISIPMATLPIPEVVKEEQEKKHGSRAPVNPVAEPVELILNPMKGEQVTFPFDENFEGEVKIMDAAGVVVFKLNVRQGFPNTWDGMTQHGGLAPSGQYILLMQSLTEQEIKQGYITIVR